MYKTMQIFTYNIFETPAMDDLGWYPERKAIRGRSIDGVVARIAAEARASKTQARCLHYRVWLDDEVVTAGSFGVRLRFRVDDRVQGTGTRERDVGELQELEDDRGRIAWDGGAIAWHPLVKLRPYGRT